MVIAYDGPRRPVRPDDLSREPAHRLAAESVTGILGHEWMLPPEAQGTILTDEFNPIDFFDRRTRERVRAQIIVGARVWSLGPRRLRAETAAIAACTVLILGRSA